MRWIILVFTSLLLFFSCKKIERINPVDGIVGVQTSSVQQLDLSSVQIGSTLQVTEEVPYVTQRGVCWSTSPNPTTANDFVAQGSGFGTFQSKITGLAANTTYYFRSFASNEKTTAYGNEVSYTIKAPVLRTKTAIDVSYTSAKVGGELIDNNGFDVVEYGIYWGVFPGVNSKNTKLASTQKVFTFDLTELENGKTYYYRTFVQTNLGVAYGEELSFNTLGFNTPSLITKLVTSIGSNSATSGGEITSDGGLTIIEKGVCWSTSVNPSISDSRTNEGYGSANFLSQLIFLEEGKKYYVRAYATNSKGTSYGREASFTTSIPKPILVDSNNCNSLTGITSWSLSYTDVLPWYINSNGYIGNCWGTTNSVLTHSGYVQFNRKFSSKGYIEFWARTYNGSQYPNLMPQIFVNQIEIGKATTDIGEFNIRGDWFHVRSPIIQSGNNTIKILIGAKYYYPLQIDEIKFFEFY